MPFAGTDKIDPLISPLVQKQGGGGGDFTNSPLSFTGFTNDLQLGTLGGVADSVIRFRGSGAIPNTTQGLLQMVNTSASFVSAPNQPNWHEDVGDPGVPNAGDWAVALTAINFVQGVDITQFRDPVGFQPTLGQFFDLNVFQRDYTMFGQPNGVPGRREAELTFEIADRLDTSDVQARATIILIHERS